jgi:hypothetical protein
MKSFLARVDARDVRSSKVNDWRAPFGMVGPTMHLILSMLGYISDTDKAPRQIGMSSLTSTLAKLSLLLLCDLSTGSLFEGSSASILFERRLRSLESLSSGQQRLHIIRLQALVPRIAHYRPAAPLYHSIVDFSLLEFLLAINPLISARNTVAID